MSTILLQLFSHASVFYWFPYVHSISNRSTSKQAFLSQSPRCWVRIFLKVLQTSFFDAVLFTLYARVAQSLPRTSDLKMIEIWLLFHIIIPFLIYFILFWQEHNGSYKIGNSSNGMNSRMDRKGMEYLEVFSRFYLPFIISVFVVIFFLVCFAKYYS